MFLLDMINICTACLFDDKNIVIRTFLYTYVFSFRLMLLDTINIYMACAFNDKSIVIYIFLYVYVQIYTY